MDNGKYVELYGHNLDIKAEAVAELFSSLTENIVHTYYGKICVELPAPTVPKPINPIEMSFIGGG